MLRKRGQHLAKPGRVTGKTRPGALQLMQLCKRRLDLRIERRR
jgi:hypothetical protein